MTRGGTILLATAVAGTLDILSAFVFAGMAGMTVGGVLRFVASGPFGDAALTGGAAYEPLGLLVHYAIMLAMAAVFVVGAERVVWLRQQPILAGITYGLILWGIMYWIVRPLRWPAMPLPHTLLGISEQLFSHLLLVGIPIALITRRGLGRSD